MPFNMAMKEVDTGIIGFETNDEIASWFDLDGIAADGCRGRVADTTWKGSVGVGSGEDLEVVTVETGGVLVLAFMADVVH